MKLSSSQDKVEGQKVKCSKETRTAQNGRFLTHLSCRSWQRPTKKPSLSLVSVASQISGAGGAYEESQLLNN
jgi:hypothetical protein